MLYVCIPVHNEATTIGVLLWRIRTVLQEYTREYEVVVYDDGSTDATAEVLEPYRRVLPLTVLRAQQRRGVAFAVDALCRHVIAHTRYPRRDAVVLMQGDFTDRPEDLPELAKRFEGGADLVIGRRPASLDQPQQERRLRRLAPWVLRPFVRVAEVEDLLTVFRLVRVSVLRDLARTRGDALLAEGEGWAATVDFALAVAPYARRVDVVDLPGRYDLRPRASRLDWWRELRGLAGYAWRSRGRRVAAGERLGERGAERPERAAERAPERAEVAVIGSVSALAGAAEGARVAERPAPERPGRVPREKRRPERPERAERPERVERAERPERPERAERPERPKRTTEAADAEAPRKRTKPRRADAAVGGSPAGDAVLLESGATSAQGVEATPAVRPPRAERAARRTERPPRDAVAEASAIGAEEASAVQAAPAVDALVPTSDADAGAMGGEPGGEEGGEATVRRKARRRRRRSRGGSAAAGDAGANGEAGDETGGDARDVAEAGDGGEAGDPVGATDRGEPRGATVESFGGDASDLGEEGEGGATEGAAGDGPRRKRARRRRRGRGRGERGEGGAGPESVVDAGDGGTDAPDGVADRTTGMGVAAPRASDPDPAAD